MEDSDPLDSINYFSVGKGNQSIQMFLISLSLTVIAFLIIVINKTIGLPFEFIGAIQPFAFLTSFVISIVGISIGTSELKYSKNRVKTGITGNAIILGIQIAYIAYEIYWLFNAPWMT